MRGADSLAKGVKCPFWSETDDETRIMCESFYDKSCAGVLFMDSRACRRYKREICSSGYKSCPLYQGLMATKYKEE